MPMQTTIHDGWEQASTCESSPPMSPANTNYQMVRALVSTLLHRKITAILDTDVIAGEAVNAGYPSYMVVQQPVESSTHVAV